MADSSMNIDKFLETKLIPNVLKSENVKLLKSSYKLLTSEAIFLARLYYVHLEVVTSNMIQTSIEIVLKFSQQTGDIVDIMPMKELYQNENTFYKEYLQYMPGELKLSVPKFYNGDVNLKNYPDYVAIEYLKSYRLTDSVLFLPNDHIVMALEKLGYFHGINYVLKETNRNKFNYFCEKFVEARYKDVSLDKKQMLFQYYLSTVMNRGFQYVPKLNKYPQKLIQRFQDMFQQPYNMCCELIRPKNDIAVLCHGDFNRNNLMFEYTDKNELKSLKMIDFQTVRYSSPAIDLSFILIMNAKHELLKQNFEKWFKVYHNIVLKTIKENSPNTDLHKYSLEIFLKDYAQHAVYGYSITAFFMEPMDDRQTTFSFDTKYSKCNTLDDIQKYVNEKVVNETILIHHGHALDHCLNMYAQYCYK